MNLQTPSQKIVQTLFGIRSGEMPCKGTTKIEIETTFQKTFTNSPTLQKSPRHLPKKYRGENLGIKNSNKTDVSFFTNDNLPITLARLSLRENFVSLELYRTRHVLNWLAVVEKDFESVARFEGSKFEFGADEIHWT